MQHYADSVNVVWLNVVQRNVIRFNVVQFNVVRVNVVRVNVVRHTVGVSALLARNFGIFWHRNTSDIICTAATTKQYLRGFLYAHICTGPEAGRGKKS